MFLLAIYCCKVSLGIVSLNYPRVHSRVYFPETPCRNNPMQDYHGAYEIEIRYSKRHLRVFPSSMDRGCVNSTDCTPEWLTRECDVALNLYRNINTVKHQSSYILQNTTVYTLPWVDCAQQLQGHDTEVSPFPHQILYFLNYVVIKISYVFEKASKK